MNTNTNGLARVCVLLHNDFWLAHKSRINGLWSSVVPQQAAIIEKPISEHKCDRNEYLKKFGC